ncbi:hypothetical protein ACYSNU_16695 [Enterococcus sp. LJL120]
MNKKIDLDDLGSELLETEHLLFFLGESLDSIQRGSVNYRRQKGNSAKLLAHETDRNIDQLVTLQYILIGKIQLLRESFE